MFSSSCSSLPRAQSARPSIASYTTAATSSQRYISQRLFRRLGRNPSCRCSSDLESRVADEVYMQEYAKLKSTLLDTTRKSGGALAAYLLFTVGGTSGLCALIGMGFSNLYLLWLFRDVDNMKPTDKVPMMEAKEIEMPVQRAIAMWLASYYHSFNARLVVPISLAALMTVYNNISEQPLGGMEEAGLLLGFLSYKVALIIKVADEVSPKRYMTESSRPKIDRFEEEEQLDRWGRPMKPQYTLPTEALPEDVDLENPGLLPSLLVKVTDDFTSDDDSDIKDPNKI